MKTGKCLRGRNEGLLCYDAPVQFVEFKIYSKIMIFYQATVSNLLIFRTIQTFMDFITIKHNFGIESDFPKACLENL